MISTVHSFKQPAAVDKVFLLPAVVTTRQPGQGRWASVVWVIALMVITGSLPGRAFGQTVFNFLTPLAVGVSPAASSTVTVTVSTAGTVASIAGLTQGSPNLDFGAAGASCAVGTPYAIGDQCTVTVTFLPTYPGRRHGAAVLRASDGTPLGTSYLEGSATGPLSVLVKGEINTVAGNTSWTYDKDGVLATQTSIFLPQGEVTDAAGNLYIADSSNNRIRRVDTVTGLISTIAGGSSQGFGGDGGPGTSATLNNPTALALDGAGNLYIDDRGNAVIRVLNLYSHKIETIAGVPGQVGYIGDTMAATSANLSLGLIGGGLALDRAHGLYIADVANNVIRKVDLTTRIIMRFAGSGSPGYFGDEGSATSAMLNTPLGINFGSDGSLYIADSGNLVIRKVAPDGKITTVAGGGTGTSDGVAATASGLNAPAAVALDQADNLYIADTGSNLIRKVNAVTQKIQTVAGTGGEQMAGDGQNADQAQFHAPYSIYYDGRGNLFIGDYFHNRIREINGSLATFSYDPLRAGRTSPPKFETIENDGNADLNLGTAGLLNAALDPATTTCGLPGTLTQGTACVLGVAFAPALPADPALGTVTLPSNAADSPALINLSGKALLVDPTTTTLLSSINPSVDGSAVIFKATVITQGTTLSGNVEFFDNGTTDLGGASLSASGNMGHAQITTSALSVGLHSITAVYQGDSTNGTSTSAPPLAQFVKQTSKTALTQTPNTSVEGGAVLLTAVVTASGVVVPTGAITFFDGGTTLGTGTLDASGTTTLSISTLAIGTHELTASYAGDTNNSPSASNPSPQLVMGQGSSIVLGTSNAEVPLGTPVTFMVLVTGTGTSTATGKVLVKDGTTLLGTVLLDVTGAGALTTAALTAGPHTITAAYQGDANYAGSSAAPLTETIDQLLTGLALASSGNPSAAGAPIVLTATVTTAPGGVGGPITGTVTFFNAGAAIGTGAVGANGTATLKIATLPLGGDNLSASYGGATNYQKSTSAAVTETIVQATSTTGLASSLNPSIVEGPITLTATVATNGGLATGVVTFNDGGTVLGQAKLNGQGVATISVASLLVGAHTLTASYAGDALDLPSASAGLTQAIQLHPSSDGLTSSATSLSGGQQVTLISVVQWTDAIVPTGTVTFYSGTTSLGAAPVDGTGVATLTILPQQGVTTVHSVYGGDSIFLGSASTDLPIKVGAPPQFIVSATPTAMSLVSLDHSTVQVSVTSVKGFSDNLAFGCLGLPKAATCTFSIDRTMLAANGTNQLTVVVDTGSPLTAGSVAKTDAAGSLVVLCGLPAGALLCLLLRRRPRWAGLLVAVCALGAMTGLSGCGTLTINGTPPGVYPFQITAAAQGAGVIEAVNMTLTVTK